MRQTTLSRSDIEQNKDKRTRNNESCRRNRKIWKDNDQAMSSLYESNERKIANLENLASKLSDELNKGTSSGTRNPKSRHK